jgi:DNA-binding GntR family transcriptional regulator
VGERVPQDDIAAELGVSRVPVREAVIALDREGWVVIQPHRGAFVVGLDENSTRDHYELLGRVYGYGAHRTAERATDEQIAALGAVHRQLQAATDPREFNERNMQFLRLLIGMAASRRVSSTVRLMAVSIVPGDFFVEVPDAIRIHKRHLRAVMKALKARDGDAAEAEIVAALRQEAELVVDLLTKRGIIGPAAGNAELPAGGLLDGSLELAGDQVGQLAGGAEQQGAGPGPLEVQVSVVLPGEAHPAVQLDGLSRDPLVRLAAGERGDRGDVLESLVDSSI